MKRSETIDKSKKEYLAGKNDEQIADFEAKDDARKYAAIMAWKRRRDMKEAGVSAIPDIIKMIRSASKAVAMLDSLADKESERLLDEIDNLRRNVADFDSIRALRELRELEEHKHRLEQRMEQLRAKAFGNSISNETRSYINESTE